MLEPCNDFFLMILMKQEYCSNNHLNCIGENLRMKQINLFKHAMEANFHMEFFFHIKLISKLIPKYPHLEKSTTHN